MNDEMRDQDEPEEDKWRMGMRESSPVRRVMTATRLVVLAAVLALSLALNVATVAIGSVAAVASAAFEAVTGLTSVMGQLDRERRSKSAELEAERTRTMKLNAEADALKVSATRKSKALYKASDSLTRASSEIQRRDGRIAQLNDELTNIRRSLEVDFRGKRKLAKEAVAETTQTISVRTARAASRNVAATFGEGIPWLGLGVIVGVTTLELKDACDTMKDLHALDVAFNPQNANDPDVNEVCGMRVPTKEELWQAIKASPEAAWNRAKEYVPKLPAFGIPDGWKAWE